MKIKIIVFDIDGVLTDGKVLIDENGNEQKKICLSDLDFMTKLKQEGYKLAAITGEQTQIAGYFEKKIPWDLFVMGSKQKDEALRDVITKLGCDLSETAYIGDGLYDLPAVKIAGMGICPSNAADAVKRESDFVLEKRGGEGCIEELYEIVRHLNRMEENRKPFVSNNLSELTERYPVLEDVTEKIMAAYDLMVDAYADGNKILVMGNGGSASDSEHIVGELMKSFKIKRPVSRQTAREILRTANNARGHDLIKNLEQPLAAISLTGHTALSTAFLNDVGGRYVFAQQVLGFGKAGDVLIGISTSGRSENVIYACIVAKAVGMKIIGLTGADGGELAKISDCAVIVPETETYSIQELHLPIYHWWCAMIEKHFFDRNESVHWL